MSFSCSFIYLFLFIEKHVDYMYSLLIYGYIFEFFPQAIYLALNNFFLENVAFRLN